MGFVDIYNKTKWLLCLIIGVLLLSITWYIIIKKVKKQINLEDNDDKKIKDFGRTLLKIKCI